MDNLVTANPGFWMLSSDGNEVGREPIIAWRVRSKAEALPVTLGRTPNLPGPRSILHVDGTEHSYFSAIECPDGSVWDRHVGGDDPVGDIYESVNDWLADVRERTRGAARARAALAEAKANPKKKVEGVFYKLP